jgi:hypothetical protein
MENQREREREREREEQTNSKKTYKHFISEEEHIFHCKLILC